MKSLKLVITEENYKHAIEANSGACIVADAIKEQYSHLSDVKVDTAHIRVTDRKTGERYMFLTPPSVVDTLLFFDQGWKEDKLPKKLRIRDLLRISPIARSASAVKRDAQHRASRLAELEAKEQKGETLTPMEKSVLTRMRNRSKPVERPTSHGPIIAAPEEGENVSRGGRLIRVGGKHPNMLAGKTRHFGQKTAQPSRVFKEALVVAVKEALADRKSRRRSPTKTAKRADEIRDAHEQSTPAP